MASASWAESGRPAEARRTGEAWTREPQEEETEKESGTIGQSNGEHREGLRGESIDNNKIPKLIGVGGRRATKMKQESRVKRIKSIKGDDGGRGRMEITGSKEAIEKAIVIIQEVLRGSLGITGQATEVLEVARGRVEAIRGEEGERIKQLQKDCGAYIEVQEKETGERTTAEIIGEEEERRTAIARIQEMTRVASKRSGDCGSGTGPRPESASQVEGRTRGQCLEPASQTGRQTQGDKRKEG